MPLLAEEPALFPINLFQDAALRGEAGLRWEALYVKARAEKAVARKLLGHGLSFFLPLHKHEWQSGGRRRCSHLPLFPGYVFLLANDDARIPVLETNLVLRFLPVVDQEQLHGDLARVHHLIETGAPLEPVERLTPGTLVEIVRGPLAGSRGKVIRQGKQLRFVIEVQFLQRGVSLEIDGRMIRPIDQALPVGA
jgi:transcriptional antiterminator RfaH